MVAKISFGSSLYGALVYNAEKIDEGEGKVLGANKTYYNKEGTFNIHTCMEDFSYYMTVLKFWIFYFERTFYFDVFTKEILSWRLAGRRGVREQYLDGQM